MNVHMHPCKAQAQRQRHEIWIKGAFMHAHELLCTLQDASMMGTIVSAYVRHVYASQASYGPRAAACQLWAIK